MSLEEFARKHLLDSGWIELRRQCEQIVTQPDFWARTELPSEARELAVTASDQLAAVTKRAKL